MEDQTKTKETGTSLSFTTTGSNKVDVEEEDQTIETGTTLCFTTAESNKVDKEDQTKTMETGTSLSLTTAGSSKVDVEKQTKAVDIADQNLEDGSTALQQGVRFWHIMKNYHVYMHIYIFLLHLNLANV